MPLVVPAHFEYIRYLGIDPGLNNSGLATLDQNFYTGKIERIDPYLLITDKLRDDTGMDEEYHTERNIKLLKIFNTVSASLGCFNPAMVGCEAPFFNRLRPMAFGALSEVVNTIQMAVVNYNPCVQMHLFPPMTVKKHVKAKAVANDTEKGKFEVKLAIMANPEIMAALTVNIDLLSEHELDAVAVVYTLAKLRSPYYAWQNT